MNPDRFIETELAKLERRAEQWIAAIQHQLALPVSARRVSYTDEQMEAEIENNRIWLSFIREARERFQFSQQEAA
jgi:hypothetical protein